MKATKSSPRFHRASFTWHPQGVLVPVPGQGRAHAIDIGNGPNTVVFLHGFVMSSWSFRHNLDALAKSHRVIAICHKGFGFSDKPGKGYSFQELAEYAQGVLDEMGVERFSLIGHSMGGAVAMIMAANAPDRVRKLMLVCSAGMPWALPGTLGRLPDAVLRAAVRVIFQRQSIQQVLQRMGYRKPLVNTVYMDTYMRAVESPGFRGATLETVRQFSGSLQNMQSCFSKLECPVAMVWGRYDRIVPIAAGEAMRKRIPGAVWHVLEGSGHCPHEEEPDRFNAIAEQFMATDDP